ncbi:MAG: proton-conducting membrane transporter [Burkholderiales bacterium]|nr:proton-conducting membrane transporter [Burkholderiales bacterium]
MDDLLIAAVVLLLGSAVCLLPMRNTLRASVGLLAQATATVLTWVAVLPVLAGASTPALVFDWAYPIGQLRFQLDPLGAFFLCWSLPMTLLGAVYAVGYLRPFFDSRRHVGVHFALLNLTSLSFLMVYTGGHAVTFLMGWEVAALSAWLLVIWDYTNQKVRFAGFNYLVSTHIGLMFLVAAFMVLYTQSHSWYLDDFGAWMRQHPGPIRNAVFLLLLTSFALKSAFFPFHSWLPRAHAAAPANVSALMSGVIHKAGLFGLLHFVLLLGKPHAWMGWLVLAFSATSAVMGALYSTGQRDLKRLLGYSSTENVGIAGMGFGIGMLGMAWEQPTLTALGFGGGLLHVLNHAFFKCLLFYAAGSVYQCKHSVDMERLGGLAHWMPWTASFFLVGGVAIAGLPPLNGFVSEFAIYNALFADGGAGLWARLALTLAAMLLAFVGAVSTLSITRAFAVIFMGQARDDSLPPAQEPNLWMNLPIGLHAAGAAVLGLVPLAGLALVQAPVQLFLAAAEPTAAQHALQQLHAVLGRAGTLSACVVGAVALAWALRWWLQRGHSRPTGPTWGCGYGTPGPRLQTTGSSFSHDFLHHYRSVLGTVQRQKLPTGYFPDDAYVVADCADAVERRLYHVIGQGNSSASLLSQLMHEDDPRLAFALGLAAIVVIAALVVLAEGPLL